MKKLLLFLLALILCLGVLAACDDSTTPSTGETPGGDETPCTHTFGEWANVIHATCETNGMEERICSACGEKEERSITALGHDEANHEAKAPTCLEKGWEAYVTCSRCDYTTYAELSALDHSFATSWAYNDTAHYHACTRNGCEATSDVAAHVYDGELDESCNVCASIRETHCSHSVTETVAGYAATCTTTGMTNGTKCTACGETIIAQQTIDALDHDYEGVITTAPTCTDHGVKTYTCKNDASHTYTSDVDALGHDYEGITTTPATCIESGVMTYTCKNDASHTYTTFLQKRSHNIVNGICMLCQGKAVSTVADLKNVFYGLNGKYILVNDIDLGGTTWTPIGYAGNPFTGSFDGNGYTISNFKIYNSYDADTAGLFGYSTGVILNLGITSVTLNLSYMDSAGSLVGLNCGKIINCYAIGTASVSHGGTSRVSIGGLVGYNYEGRIENCYAMVTVSGKNTEYGTNVCNTGGLVGCNNGTILNCYATGNVQGTSTNSDFNHHISISHTGGLVGRNELYGTIENCYASGNVSGYSYGGTETHCYIGGLVGVNDYAVTNCYATGNITANSRNRDGNKNWSYCYAGGLVGNRGAINSYCYTGQTYRLSSNSNNAPLNSVAEKKDMSVLQSTTFLTSTLGWSSDYWLFSEGSHPTLKTTGRAS